MAAIDVDQVETRLTAVAREGDRAAVRADGRVEAVSQRLQNAGRQMIGVDLTASTLLKDDRALQPCAG